MFIYGASLGFTSDLKEDSETETEWAARGVVVTLDYIIIDSFPVYLGVEIIRCYSYFVCRYTEKITTFATMCFWFMRLQFCMKQSGSLVLTVLLSPDEG